MNALNVETPSSRAASGVWRLTVVVVAVAGFVLSGCRAEEVQEGPFATAQPQSTQQAVPSASANSDSGTSGEVTLNHSSGNENATTDGTPNGGGTTVSGGDNGGTTGTGSTETGSFDAGTTESLPTDAAEDDIGQQYPVSGTILLSWRAPSEREDGTPLGMSELSGYNIYYGSVANPKENTIAIEDSAIMSHRLEGIPSGTYQVAVSAVDMDGRESALSNSMSKTIP